MKNLFYSIFFILLFSGSALAQLSGERTVPSADYPDLAAVADSLNLYGVGSGGINFMLQSGNTFEELPLEFTSSGNEEDPVYIGWDGEGVKPIVNFEGTESDGDAGFTLSGVDYYTLDGFEITNSNSNLETAILITNIDDLDGAHFNTVENLNITLDKLNPFQSVGITVTAQTTPSVFDGNNHYNKFYNNHISNVIIGYLLDGSTSTTSLMSVGNEVGIEAGGESIIDDLVLAGVSASDQNGFNFSNTTIRDLTRIGTGNTAPAAIATSSGNPSEPLTNDFVIANNTIEDLTSSFTSIFGMYLSARKATYYVNSNKINNVTATGGGGNTADGIMMLATDAVANIYNNMVSEIAAPASSIGSNAATRGITVRTYDQANVFYNSVLLDFESTDPAQKSAAFVIYNNTDSVQIRNNIFINKSTLPTGATGMISAVFKRNNTFSNIMAGTDDNIYYAGVPGPHNAIFYGHSSSAPNIQETLADYKTAAATFDQNSYTEDVPFIANDDLHIVASASTVVLNNATPITEPIEITTDFDGSVRGPGATDIGADEVASPTPDMAINPNPADGEMDVSTDLSGVTWDYLTSPEFTTPAAFQVYVGDSPDFEGSNLIGVVSWEDGGTNYSAAFLEPLSPGIVYYWKVVPTTTPSGGFTPDSVPVWTFTTEAPIYGYPNPAENPSPENNGIANLTDDHVITFGWDFIPESTYSLPDHFELYAATDTNDVAWQTPIDEIDYQTGQVAYQKELTDNPNFTYEIGINNFWKIVPVSATDDATPDVPVWIFKFDENIGLNELSSDGTVIYPNPAVNFVNIEPGFEGKYDVILYGVQGRLVTDFGEAQGNRTVNISTVQSGAYQLVIRQGESQFVSLIEVK